MNFPFNIADQTAAFITAFVISLVMGPVVIPVLRRLKVGQTIRDDGPVTHLKKSGIPNMGGVIFILPLIIISIVSFNEYPDIFMLAAVTAAYGLIGFADDYIKVVRKHKDGLSAKHKMLSILAVACAFTIYGLYTGVLYSGMVIPLKGVDISIAIPVWLYIPLSIFVFASAANAVNLTDGVDGLAGSVTLIIMVFLTIVAMTNTQWDYIKIFSAAAAGGCLGFLVFNLHPARVFMGDTGSLALGGALSAIVMLLGMPWVLLVAGFIYVIEALSVIIQVTSYKTTGRRVFRMAPLHHHFELSGWNEHRVVAVFCLITIVCCIISLKLLRINLF